MDKMKRDISKENSKVIRQQKQEWIDEMFTAAEGNADINSVMLFSPLIQMLNNELTDRFVKRTTVLALFIAGVSLVVSFAALYVAYTSSLSRGI